MSEEEGSREIGETKAEAKGGETGAGAGAGAGVGAGEETVEGLERASATMFSGSGTWTMELVYLAR